MAFAAPFGSPPPAHSAGERARLAAAVVAVVGSRGFEASSVDAVLERAELDGEAFARHFADLQQCCSQIYAGFVDDFNRFVFGEILASGADRWRDRLRVAAYAAARFFADHPDEVRFSVTGILGAGEMVQVQRERHLSLMVDFVDAARAELAEPASMSRAAAESTVGSIFGFLLKEVNVHGDARSAEALVPELMYIAVLPYFGEDAAREELTLPAPVPASLSPAREED